MKSSRFAIASYSLDYYFTIGNYSLCYNLIVLEHARRDYQKYKEFYWEVFKRCDEEIIGDMFISYSCLTIPVFPLE